MHFSMVAAEMPGRDALRSRDADQAGGMFRTPAASVNLEGASMSTIAPSLLETVWHAVSGVLLPPTCCLCGALGQSAGALHRRAAQDRPFSFQAARRLRASSLDLCEVCATLLPRNRKPHTRMRRERSVAIQLIVPFEYAYPVDAWVRALKFGGERLYARVLGVLLARERAALQVEVPSLRALPELIVPVPLHAKRYRDRGFNQAAEIAEAAGRVLRVPVNARALTRRIATREQSGLSVRKRRRNVRDAFVLAHAIPAAHIALVDDVVTTGSTARAAAHALVERGVRQVEIWAAAQAVLTRVSRNGV
jgi:ComF family protein